MMAAMIGVATLGVVLGSSSQVTAHDGGDGPNIVLIQADDAGVDDLSYRPHITKLQQPHLEQFCADSVELTHFYMCPVCAPSRAALLTGRDPIRAGVWGLQGGGDYLHPGETTFAQAVKQTGYKTAFFGKWHCGKQPGYFPWDKGFDEAYYASQYVHRNTNGIYNGEYVSTTEWCSTYLVDKSIAFMQNCIRSKRKFLLYLSFLDVHEPLHVKDNIYKKYIEMGLSKRVARLYAMLEHMDRQIGRLLSEIDRQGLSDRTVVVVTSDNGPALRGRWKSEGGALVRYVFTESEMRQRRKRFRGHKGTVYEGGIRSYCFIRWSGVYSPGRKISVMARDYDIFATILDWAGVRLPRGHSPIDGKSLASVLKDPTLANRRGWINREFYFQTLPFPKKLTDPNRYRKFDIHQHAIRRGKYKFIVGPSTRELYDLSIDSREKNNLIASGAATAYQLESKLRIHFDSVKKHFAMPVSYIGWNDGRDAAMVHSVLAFRHSSNVTRYRHWSSGWRQAGDYADYKVVVKRSGIYRVYLNFENVGRSVGSEFVLSIGAAECTGVVKDQKKGREELFKKFRSIGNHVSEMNELGTILLTDRELGYQNMKLELVRKVGRGEVFNKFFHIVLVWVAP